MSNAPTFPTEKEINDAHLTWEYEQDYIDVTAYGDPPGSRPPLIVVRRRLVGKWEPYDG